MSAKCIKNGTAIFKNSPKQYSIPGVTYAGFHETPISFAYFLLYNTTVFPDFLTITFLTNFEIICRIQNNNKKNCQNLETQLY